jgi:hypothetical protein
MALDSLKDLLINELRDVLHAERRAGASGPNEAALAAGEGEGE